MRELKIEWTAAARFALIILLLVCVTAGCSGAISGAKKSEASRDYSEAIYLYATAVVDGNMQEHEFKLKMMEIKQKLGKDAFCFHLDKSIKLTYENTSVYLKQGNDNAANNEAERSSHMVKTRKTYCQ